MATNSNMVISYLVPLLLSLYRTERVDFYWRCHHTNWFAPVSRATPFTGFEPNPRVGSDLVGTEQFMDTYASALGMGIEQHLLALAGVRNQPEYATGAQRHAGDLDAPKQAADQQSFFAPGKLKGLTEGKSQRYECA